MPSASQVRWYTHILFTYSFRFVLSMPHHALYTQSTVLCSVRVFLCMYYLSMIDKWNNIWSPRSTRRLSSGRGQAASLFWLQLISKVTKIGERADSQWTWQIAFWNPTSHYIQFHIRAWSNSMKNIRSTLVHLNPYYVRNVSLHCTMSASKNWNESLAGNSFGLQLTSQRTDTALPPQSNITRKISFWICCFLLELGYTAVFLYRALCRENNNFENCPDLS